MKIINTKELIKDIEKLEVYSEDFLLILDKVIVKFSEEYKDMSNMPLINSIEKVRKILYNE